MVGDTINKKYPRVLIIGQTFSGISGASITLRNLFERWPKENLAVASMGIDEYDEITFEYCINNYKLGNNEISILPPFNKFYSLSPSMIVAEAKNKRGQDNNGDFKSNNKLKKKLKKLLIKTGLNSIRIKYRLSEEFLLWYIKFSPQLIYSAVGDLDIIQFLLKLKKIDNAPLALHIWDDWPNTLSDRTYFKAYWRKRFDKEFRLLLNESNKLFSISDAMTVEYRALYGKEFVPFHNPIDKSKWGVEVCKEKNDVAKTVLYVGKINSDTLSLLKMMAQAVEILNSNKQAETFIFKIYSPDSLNNSKFFEEYESTIISKAIPHEQIIGIIKSADILFLPLGFSKRSIKYTRLSMPTKVSEYMMSGVPIIVMAPREIALTKYAIEYQWAEVVDKMDVNKLQESLIKLSVERNEEKLTKIKELAQVRHDSTNVRNRFRMELLKIARYD